MSKRILGVVPVLLALVGPPARAADVTDGLVHRWSGDGDTTDDVSGADGVAGTSTAYAAGLSGEAFDFDGSQAAVMTLPVNLSPSAQPEVTFGMWVRLDTIANARGWVLGHDNGGFDRSIALHDNRYGSRVAGGTGTTPHASTLIQPASNLATWICVAAAYDGSQATFYSAKLGAASQAQTVTASPGGGATQATLGGLSAAFGSHTIDGRVDNVFMYDRALTQAELDDVCGYFDGDMDDDGVSDDDDACEGSDDALDADGDGNPDGCDACPDDASDDSDGDGSCDSEDLCVGDDTSGDADGDLTCDDTDNCPDDANDDQSDVDGDGIGDVCEADADGDGWIDDDDNCVDDVNADQLDTDGDGDGDACDDDDDDDGVDDGSDNCPVDANADQTDADGDGDGDVCDDDDDDDGYDDGDDACPGTAAGAITDDDGCSGAQLVAKTCAGAATHGAYVSCVTHAAKDAYSAGLLTNAERAALVKAAAHKK